MKTESQTQKVTIEPIQLATMTLNIVSLPNSTLLMNKMSDSTRNQMIARTTGQSTEKAKYRDLKKESEDKIHYDEKGKIAMPTDAFKKAMVEVAPYLNDMDKKRAKGSFQIMGNYTPLKFKKQTINKAVTRDSGISRAPRETWRPEFEDWSCKLLVQYNFQQITPLQIIELAKLSGFHIGVGAWRPQCSGSHGLYTVG
jgi:small-conductance mechanosensitive channel